MTSRRKLSTVYEHEHEEEESEVVTVPCDQWDSVYHGRHDLNEHRQTPHLGSYYDHNVPVESRRPVRTGTRR